jgi:taurine dioxygenase/pentalenolactone F synthase
MIKVTPLANEPFGAIVESWDPETAPDATLVEQIRSALTDHLVLVFRGHPHPSDEALVRFGSAFGPLVRGAAYFGNADAFPEILRVTNRLDDDGVPIGVGSSNGCDWHADYSYMPTVGDVSFLECTAHPSTGGATYFCDMYTPLAEMEPGLLQQLEAKTAHHDALAAERTVTAEDAEKKRASGRHTLEQKPFARHPVITEHPRNRRRALYVNPMLTRYICDMPADDSHATLERLYHDHIRHERIYKHSWQPGDMVVWDTIGTVHRRDSFPAHEVRDMRQMSTLWARQA